MQEVKEVLGDKFKQTRIRGDGQVVEVAFNTLTIEIVPVFRASTGQFWMPDTNGGGRWKITDPIAQINYIDGADTAVNGNVRPLAKMMKLWARERQVPIKSFAIELLAAQFLPARGNGGYDAYWYDYYVRDFLYFLLGKTGSFIEIPGTYDSYFLGKEWESKARAALDAANVACHYERTDQIVAAGQEWQKIFGSRIPVDVAI
ncbi:hypothetical protein D4Q52_14775 [Rhodopseudomonas palustris]|uniref:Nucleotidyltransferase n=1 Tax=Rhodopseudomonas palustris TaxID=1076 RepID=A0A418V452_RHOPL|nr:hypothetical protein D4Q52_14775 [Rhodopseudomonas palustris]